MRFDEFGEVCRLTLKLDEEDPDSAMTHVELTHVFLNPANWLKKKFLVLSGMTEF